MPDVFDSKPDDGQSVPQLREGMIVSFQNYDDWTVLNPHVLDKSGQELILIGRGPYYYIRWTVTLDELIFPEQKN
jgi:hypothetical protein